MLRINTTMTAMTAVGPAPVVGTLDIDTTTVWDTEADMKDHQMLCALQNGMMRATGITVGELRSLIQRVKALEEAYAEDHLLGKQGDSNGEVR